MGSWENYLRSIGQQNNYNNPSLRAGKVKTKNIDRGGKETCA